MFNRFYLVEVSVCLPGPDRNRLLSEVYGTTDSVSFDHYHSLHVLFSYLGAGVCCYCLGKFYKIAAYVFPTVVW